MIVPAAAGLAIGESPGASLGMRSSGDAESVELMGELPLLLGIELLQSLLGSALEWSTSSDPWGRT